MQIRDRIKSLRRVKASELVPNPKNWRTHPQAQQDALRGLLSEVGYADALLARELKDGRLMLIDGHLRAETTPDQKVPVLVLDVTAAEADKILASLDPLAAMAEANAEKLGALLAEVETDSEALSLLLQDLAAESGIGPAVEPGGGGDEFDATPETTGPTRTAVGDLWLIGGVHRLIVGDCTDAGVVARLMGEAKPELMITDPPYGVEYDPNWRNEAADKGLIAHAAVRVGEVANDDRIDWTLAWENSPAIVAYCWHADRHASTVQASLEAAGYDIRLQIIWAKSRFAISRGHYHWQHEPCWYAVRKGATANWIGDHSQTTLWQIELDKNVEGGHSTQKPLECMARGIRNHSGDVYDPFLGSGTTLIAAHRLGRTCYGCEIEPRYADVILRRAEAEGMAVEKAE